MKIGDEVLYNGRIYVLRGLDPMSVPDRTVLLEDTLADALIRAPFAEVEEVENPSEFDSEGLG